MRGVWRDISEKELDSFYNQCTEEKTFLQTSPYGQFRDLLGERTFRWGFFKEKKLKGIAQFQKIPAKRGIHLHCPHGPILEKKFEEEGVQSFLESYRVCGKKEKCDFVRCSPLVSPQKTDLWKKCGYRSAPVHLVNPELTWVLDITQTEQELLNNMKKTTRYEIRRVQKVGIVVEKGNQKKDLDIFWDLHLETVRRHGFVPFARQTTEKELEIFGNDVQIFSAHIDKKYYSSSIILFDKNAAYYHQGASLPHKFPFSYATLWAAIGEAQKRGCRAFNFWGVCEKDQKNHPWFGLSKFKRGFGGEERRFLHAQDYPLTLKYWVNWGVEKYRKWKRGY